MRQIKYIALLAMALTFFFGQTNVAFSQAVPSCHDGSLYPVNDPGQTLLTTFGKYGYSWSWNGVYGPNPPTVPNPPPCPGIFMCITDTVTEAASCGACSDGDTTRKGKFFHIRNVTGGVPATPEFPRRVIDSVEITGTPKPSANRVDRLAQVCYAKRNFGIVESPNNWDMSYVGGVVPITPAFCFSPQTYPDTNHVNVFTVILTPAAADINSHSIDEGAHFTTVIWGMDVVTQVIIRYAPVLGVFPKALIISYPTVNTTHCPDGTATYE